MLTADRSSVLIEALTKKDLPQVHELVEQLRWTHVEADLEIMFRVGFFWGARSRNGEIIAAGALFPYGDDLASIGMIMVSPDHQRKGYGQAVMEVLHKSDMAQGRRLCLIATSEGEPLYRKLGYQKVSRIRKFFADPKLVLEKSQTYSLPRYTMRDVTAEDIPKLANLDGQSLGANREKLLGLRFTQSDAGVVIEDNLGKAIAFSFSCPQRQQRHIGPIAAPDRDTALAMVFALAERGPQEIRIDVPEEQPGLHELLPELGFRLIANPPAMMREANQYPGERGGYWAVMSQAYG